MKFKMGSKLHTFHNVAFYPVPFHVGLSGDTENFSSVLSFFLNPIEHKKAPRLKGEGAILTEDGRIWSFTNAGNWMQIYEPYYAIGSGMHFALGALAAGSTPVEAVRYAAKLDPSTGMGVTKIDLK